MEDRSIKGYKSQWLFAAFRSRSSMLLNISSRGVILGDVFCISCSCASQGQLVGHCGKALGLSLKSNSCTEVANAMRNIASGAGHILVMTAVGKLIGDTLYVFKTHTWICLTDWRIMLADHQYDYLLWRGFGSPWRKMCHDLMCCSNSVGVELLVIIS